MGSYKVKPLWIGGKGNKLFKAGDIVTDENFPAGNAAKLVASGHLIPILDQASSAHIPLKTMGDAVTALNGTSSPSIDLKSFDEWSVKDLRKELDITDPRIKKQQLYDMLVEREKNKSGN